ncbi:hypothetical protein N0V85_004231 [Neurospora sp. IMI 360204]|nr:hypothetical protein N0V85_004231 [Neurospora sp. IMI 360204]
MVASPKAKEATPAPASPPPPPPAAGGPPVPISAPLTAEAASNLGILPASHWQQAQGEDAADDTDDTASAIGSFLSSTASLSQSIFEYRDILGRTYHSDVGNAQAWQPNDARHAEAMDIFHHLNTLILSGKLYTAPLPKKIQKAVDIGTGTGLWAIDFADEFPDVEVIGTDVSPIQPTWVPPNVKFDIDDLNREWTWPDNTFDYIHSRSLIGVVEDWVAFYRQAFRCCKPGGYVEDVANSPIAFSVDGTVKEGSALDQWGKVFIEGGNKFGRTFKIVEDDIHRTCMEKAGFVDIVIKDIQVPVGAWPTDKTQQELGIWAKMALESDLEGYVNYIWGVVLGWTPEEISTYCAAFRRELKNTRIHGMYTTRVAYARKPE